MRRFPLWISLGLAVTVGVAVGLLAYVVPWWIFWGVYVALVILLVGVLVTNDLAPRREPQPSGQRFVWRPAYVIAPAILVMAISLTPDGSLYWAIFGGVVSCLAAMWFIETIEPGSYINKVSLRNKVG